MNDKVDVLAVLDALVAEAQAPCIGPYPDDVLQLMQARAAIAELIEADREYNAAWTAFCAEPAPYKPGEWAERDAKIAAATARMTAARYRRAAVLARVGGA